MGQGPDCLHKILVAFLEFEPLNYFDATELERFLVFI